MKHCPITWIKPAGVLDTLYELHMRAQQPAPTQEMLHFSLLPTWRGSISYNCYLQKCNKYNDVSWCLINFCQHFECAKATHCSIKGYFLTSLETLYEHLWNPQKSSRSTLEELKSIMRTDRQMARRHLHSSKVQKKMQLNLHFY